MAETPEHVFENVPILAHNFDQDHLLGRGSVVLLEDGALVSAEIKDRDVLTFLEEGELQAISMGFMVRVNDPFAIDLEEKPISEGEEWSIVDLLDASVIAKFDSWGVSDPERRARELFATYPRDASLVRKKVVKYEGKTLEVNYDCGSDEDVEYDDGDE